MNETETKRKRRTKAEMEEARKSELHEDENEKIRFSDPYPQVEFLPGKSMLSIGEVIPGKADDGWSLYNYVYINLGNDVMLAEINGKYYIDRVFEIKRLDEDLIKKYKLGKFFRVKGGD